MEKSKIVENWRKTTVFSEFPGFVKKCGVPLIARRFGHKKSKKSVSFDHSEKHLKNEAELGQN